jgi:predicted ArsR family transcriptional regulator
LKQDELPEDVRALLEPIASISELEALLLLYRSAPTEWSAERLAGELRIERSGAEQHLVALAARRLLALRQGEGVDRYRYAPGTEELDRAVDTLSSTYEKRRVSVIHVLYSKPPGSIRVFADAFRLRKEDSDG